MCSIEALQKRDKLLHVEPVRVRSLGNTWVEHAEKAQGYCTTDYWGNFKNFRIPFTSTFKRFRFQRTLSGTSTHA